MLRWKVRGYLLGGVCCVLVRGQASGDEARCAGGGEKRAAAPALREVRERDVWSCATSSLNLIQVRAHPATQLQIQTARNYGAPARLLKRQVHLPFTNGHGCNAVQRRKETAIEAPLKSFLAHPFPG